MPRSAEQEILFQKLLKFLDKYRGKTLPTDVLTAKVAEIYKGTLGVNKTPAGKWNDLFKSNPEAFKNIKLDYSVRGKGPWNVAWKNDPEWKKFFKEKNPGVKWEDLTTEQRDIKQNTWKSYELTKERAKVIPSNYIRQNDFADKVNFNKDTLKTIRTRDSYKKLNSELNKYFKPKKFKNEVWFPDPNKKDINKFNELIKANKEAGLAEMAITKGSVSNEPILALHKELIRDPDARPWELAENIYGNSKASTLRMVGNDASKYVEVLRGSRTVPGLKLPDANKIEDILSNILVPGSGFFKYGNAERRNAMLRERDEILKTKGPKLKRVRDYLAKRGVVPGMHLDETLSLAATYGKAPGYTELAQRIPDNVNILKGNTIDKDFALLLEKVIDGKDGPGTYRETPFKNLKEHVKLFNAYSKDFQKEWGIDTPTIEYKPGQKLNASHFIKHFDKLSPEAQVNVNQLADRGIVMRSKSVPMREMLFQIYKTAPKNEQTIIETILGCRKAAASGGRIGFAGGSLESCVGTKLSNESQVTKLTQLDDSSPVFSRIKNAATGFLNFAKKGGKFGAIAAAGAAGAGLVKTFMNDDPTTYLSDENQQKNMLISMITDPIDETPEESPAILDYQLPTLGAVTVAGMVPGGKRLYDVRRRGGVFPTAEGTKVLKPAGPVRSALSPIRGVLGKGLAATATPLGLAALEPLHIAGQVQAGDSLTDIATNPWNYLGPTFAAPLTREATRFAGPTVSKIMRMGMSPTVLRGLSRFGGYGLAASLGIQGLQKFSDWRNKRGWFSEDEE